VAGNADFDNLLAQTLKNHAGTMTDNAFRKHVLGSWLLRTDHVKTKDGGESIVEPLEYADNDTFGSFSGYDTLPTDPQVEATAAEFDWKLWAGNVTTSDEESKVKNAGRSKVVDLVKTKVRNLEKTISNELNEMWFGDGTGNGSKDMDGLAKLIGDETSSITIVGNINCATAGNEFWRSEVVDMNSAARSTKQWRTVYNTISYGGELVRLIITTQTLFEDYEDELAPHLRLTSNDEADALFQTLNFKGQRLYYDEQCTSGAIYFINPDYLYLVKHGSYWMEQTEWMRPTDKAARFKQVLGSGNLVVTNRSRQGLVREQVAS
jgi:hypothetical protein